MNKKLFAIVAGAILLIGGLGIVAFNKLSDAFSGSGDISYRVTQYDGKLDINQAANTANFQQDLYYDFASDYNGQYVTMGYAGTVPEGFSVDVKNVEVINKDVEKNEWSPATISGVSGEGQVTYQTNKEWDALILKIYNGGSAGDKVHLRINYTITNPLFKRDGYNELNWVPISDWDVPLNNVNFTVTGTDHSDLRVHTGYLNQTAKVTRDGDAYKFNVNVIKPGNDLGIHAYYSENASAPKAFTSTENSIARKEKLIDTLVYFGIPIGLAALLALAIFAVSRFLKRLTPEVVYDKDMNIYSVPEELPPLQVASHVYSIDLNELSPTRTQSPIAFSDLMMAVITDLIDRKLITITDKTMSKNFAPGQLSSSEQQVVDMAFGSQNTIRFVDAFEQYKVSTSGSQTAQKRAGQLSQQGFLNDVNNIARTVRQETADKGLNNLFRPLSMGERTKFFSWQSLSWIAGLILIFVGFVTFNKTFFADNTLYLLILLAIFAGFISIAVVLGSRSSSASRDGVPTEEGAMQQFQWNGFANMLRNIAHLDDKELQEVVLWNRLLVYATMFGLADEVIKMINTRGIVLDTGLTNDNIIWYRPLYYGYTGNLGNSYESFTQAANIDTSSHGGGGFSMGGGFSGGGGGGGGGAF
jgi:uncharacterized membrane protein YgcG